MKESPPASSVVRTRRRLAVALLAVLAPWALPAPVADARVNPLMVIKRQIHKANMLVMLDTSGSMTGVPGGVFSYGAEAGVDCDNGSNCRMAGVMGVCGASGKSCVSDEDCRRGVCEQDAARPCATDVDCPTDPATCSVTKGACTVDADCPAAPGTCAATGQACDAVTPCAAIGQCEYGANFCNNPGGTCPAIGTCTQDPSKTCADREDCPQASSGGNCASGGTPSSGCSSQEDCPSKQKCHNTDETCRATAECPGASKGRCSASGASCNRDSNCPAGQTCLKWTNPCIGAPNPCKLPHTPCDWHATNKCIALANACSVPANKCVVAAANRCVPPASVTDTCNASNHGQPGPIRMCRVAQTVCRKDNDCPAAGDSCGPATSRYVIAKRAINNVITNNYDVVNFGFMTFWQSGYFPYYEMTAGGTTGTVTEYQAKDKLLASNCFTPAWGPNPLCTISGTAMRLRTTVNSRYTVRTGPTSSVDVDQSYCGEFCDIKPNIGTGEYQGSYYQYSGAPGGNSTTKTVKQSYAGKVIDISGVPHTYYQAAPNYYNGALPPPFEFTDCEATNVCGPKCGARWDPQLGPFLDTSDNLERSRQNVLAFSSRLEPASYGGLMAYWATPIGCALENTGAGTANTSAYHYMESVKNGNAALGVPTDPIPCRQNFVLLITDGAANGPGDVDAAGVSLCDLPACAAADPVAAGCTCRSVVAAWNLRKTLGVKTFVVGFSGDVAAGAPRIINDNIARAGGTDAGNDGVAPFALLAQNEDELVNVLQYAIYDAVKGSYSTSPTSTSAGTQQAYSVTEGKYALDSRMDFPSWQGHLMAYDLSDEQPTLFWDAAAKMAAMNWWERRIFTWNPSTGKMVKIEIDPGTKALKNKGELSQPPIQLGTTPEEAEHVARWMMGDPLYRNPAVLGAFINSTPIDVGGPGNHPGAADDEFFRKYQERPHLVYAGAEDGLLHAFFLEQTTVGPKTYEAGSEAFAFLPPDMMHVVRKLYAQGGQKADPDKHIFGLAQSPKVKNLCVDKCTDAEAVWRTLLIMPEGYGGSDSFMLDITDPFDPAIGLAAMPIKKVEWHTEYGTAKASYDGALGNTVSLPAFFYNKTETRTDYRIMYTSGYPVTVGNETQGRSLVIAPAVGGGAPQVFPIPKPGVACAQEYTLLTDVATARDFAKGEEQKLLAAYFGDTYGRLHRYTQSLNVETSLDYGCQHPMHFSPTVVQLDRDDPENEGYAHDVYIVQVTNSSLDVVTTNLERSKMIIAKEHARVAEDGTIIDVLKDADFGDSDSRFVLDVGDDAEICAVTQKNELGEVSCKTSMPTGARPTATPLGILRKDAAGFQVFTLWYVASPNGCSKGETYLTIHQVKEDAISQRLGVKVAEEPVTSPVILNGRVYVIGSAGAMEITDLLPDALVGGQARGPRSLEGLFSRLSWTEILQ